MQHEFDPRRYSISVRYENVYDEWQFVGRVAELPDVVVFADDHIEAYEEVIDVIQTSKDLLTEQGIAFPEPAVARDRKEYSGRLPLRVTKSLHRDLAITAEREGQSLNSFCQYVLTRGLSVLSIADTAERVSSAARELTSRASEIASSPIHAPLIVFQTPESRPITIAGQLIEFKH